MPRSSPHTDQAAPRLDVDAGTPRYGAPSIQPVAGAATGVELPQQRPNQMALPASWGSDVGKARERARRHRLLRVAIALTPVAAWLWWPIVTGGTLYVPTLPSVDPMFWIVGVFFAVMLVVLLGTTVAAGRSPHITYRPEQLTTRLSDIKGIGPIKEEVTRSLQLFLGGKTFRDTMGGKPRRGLLFEGPPGTGKTMMAQALAAEAGVPFLFVSATSFQSMYYGATARKIRSYFKSVRKAARAEGGAIAFIEEIDAIATSRSGVSRATATSIAAHASPGGGPLTHAAGMHSEGTGGVVNELLIQLQSFDAPTGWQRTLGGAIDAVNLLLPATHQIPRPRPEPVDILVIAATNRADDLDPALLRPGRFDRRLTFSPPDKDGRRELIDHYLTRKAHDADLATGEYRDALASVTGGYTPARLENLLDEGLVNAIRRGADAMTWADVEHARMVVDVGVGNPVRYTDHELRLIATHEAGHAVTAWLVAPHRRLEILTIVKRADSLGLLAHGDPEDVYTRSRSELVSLIQISLGGLVAEELFFDDISTGPAGDLAYATTVAAQMVGTSGMGDSLISLGAGQAGAFGGDTISRVLGDATCRTQVDELLLAQRSRVRELMAHNRHLVEALRDALLDKHELIGTEITDVLQNAKRLPHSG